MIQSFQEASAGKGSAEERREFMDKEEMKQERSYGAVVFDEQGRILIEGMKLGHYSIPKGHVEGNETPEETAKREIKEETGLDVRLDMNFSSSEEYSPFKGVWKKVTFFLAFPLNSILIPQLCEVTRLMWLEPEEAMKILTFAGDRKVVKEAVSYYNGHYRSKKN